MDETIERQGTKYIVSYPPGTVYEDIKIQYKNVDTSGKDQYGLITVLYGSEKVLKESKLNMLSDGARGKIAVKCNSKMPVFEWGDIIDNANDLVRETYAQGNPVINLKEGSIQDSLQYLVDPFLILGRHNVLYGHGGLGKSWFALYLAALVASGKSHGKLYPEPANVLYIDYESEGEDIRNRLHALCAGIGIEVPNIHYRDQRTPIPKDEDRLRDLVAELDIGFVIVDSAAAACGGEPENAGVAASYWNSLSALENANGQPITDLTIAHVSKAEASEKGSSTPYGSVFWWNYARHAWEIKKNNTSNKLETYFGLSNTKSNSTAGDKPRNFKTIFDNGKLATKVNIIETDVTENDSLMETASAYDQAVALIKSKRKQYTENWTLDSPKRFPGITALECTVSYGGTANSYSKAFSNNKKIRNRDTEQLDNTFVSINDGYWDLKYEREEDERLFQNEPKAVTFQDI
jgi:hypothetical protein